MKKLLIIFGLTIFLCCCRTEQSDKLAKSEETDSLKLNNHTKPSQFEEAVPTKQISISDITNKYSDSDSLFDLDTYKIYAGLINNVQIRLYQNTDSTTIIYQKVKNIWYRTDNINYPITNVKQTDLNGDNRLDLVVTYFITGSGGNSETFSLLFQPLKNLFIHNKYFDLSNIQYDKKSKLIVSSWWSGGSRPQEKMTYKITGDSLTFNEGITFEPDQKTNGKNSKIEIYKMNRNKRKIVKIINGETDNIFEIFTKHLWDTSAELKSTAANN
jgi:translation initiation factor 1 (eIF-1/SUI1)